MAKTPTMFLATTPYGYENTQTVMKLAEATLDQDHNVIVFASVSGCWALSSRRP